MKAVFVAAVVVVVTLTNVGCATVSVPAVPSSENSGRLGRRPAPTTAGVVAAPLRFVDDGAFAWVDGKTGAALSFNDVVVRLKAHSVVMVGEQHDQSTHHEVQRRVVEALASPGLVVGLEMLTWDKQGALDRFNAGDVDVAGLGAAVDWKVAWGFPLALYAPIFSTGHAGGGRFVALNAPRDLVRALRTKGYDGLAAEQQAQLPELDLDDSAHRRWFESVFSSAGHPLQPAELDGFYRAQVLWDEAMADRAAAAIVVDHAEHVVVLAGAGHIAAGRGVPQRIERRLQVPVLTVLPLSVGADTVDDELRGAIARAEADIIAIPKFEHAIDI